MENVIRYYSSFDEWGRLEREPVEFLVNSHFIRSLLPAHGRILDIGAGPGKYSIALAQRGYEVTLADLTPSLVDQAKLRAREAGVESRFDGFHVADARDLGRFENEQFDACLMLGPMYHLQTEADRSKAINELRRVTKKDGLVFVAFMSRIRHLSTSLMFPEAWKPNDNVQGIVDFLETGVFNHNDEGRFTGAFYFNIEDIDPFMEARGFENMKIIASGSIAGAMKPEQWDYWRRRGDVEFEKVMEIIMKTAESPYILGSSSHLLYIGRRI
ncbi:class I SAM-dependent methyltransferase [Cohnella luojiensis]|uniref:Class I SAM-dependent methyltransferase n=1 Tax=Cohnella luojiensis TaxID=652876 RepID=A0A4Y8M0E6_9BACL|nr:class I SAM-dependent methyltransferase [Cohnella luojiensis]TFE27237.1 class I SAM-dependent methyltransferase [Cohnella luojiensis]